ncbi:MAG TPA: hypothetical protein VJ327_11275 [Patescibacteria group bacterium]|nr:hypothetical protein [Patescibacteria group bacterium]
MIDIIKALMAPKTPAETPERVYAAALQALLDIIKAESACPVEGEIEGPITGPAWDLSGKSMHTVKRLAYYDDANKQD